MTGATKTKVRPPASAEAADAEPKLRADARRNRGAILAAARKRFGEVGLECGMDDIASTAGVGVGTVYRHFPTKSELVAALVHDHFGRLAERAAQALEEDDAWEAFCDFMRWSARIQAEDRALSEYLSVTPQLAENPAVSSGLTELTEKLIKKAQRAGDMRKDLVLEDVPTLTCGLGAITAAEDCFAARNWERFLEIALDGMRAAPGASELPPPRATVSGRAGS